MSTHRAVTSSFSAHRVCTNQRPESIDESDTSFNCAIAVSLHFIIQKEAVRTDLLSKARVKRVISGCELALLCKEQRVVTSQCMRVTHLGFVGSVEQGGEVVYLNDQRLSVLLRPATHNGLTS